MLNLKIYSVSVYLIIYILWQASYQQHFVIGFTCRSLTTVCDNDCTFCIANHHTTMIATFKTFLMQDNQLNCKENIKNLLILYKNLMSSFEDTEENCYNLLLRREIRKTVIRLLKPEVDMTYGKQLWTYNKDLLQSLKVIYDIDKSIARTILEQAVWSLWLSKEPEEVINAINDLKDKELKLMAFELLYDKYLFNNEQAKTLVPLLTFYVYKLYDERDAYTYNVKRSPYLYHRLPEKLRIFYESSNMDILFYNLSTQKKKMLSPNSWLFNNNGLVAFIYNKSDSFDYLYVEHHGLSYARSTAVKSNQWWHVILTSTGYLMFCNDNTKDLLCAEEFDDQIKFILLNYKNNMKNIACQWDVWSDALVSAIECAI